MFKWISVALPRHWLAIIAQSVAIYLNVRKINLKNCKLKIHFFNLLGRIDQLGLAP